MKYIKLRLIDCWKKQFFIGTIIYFFIFVSRIYTLKNYNFDVNNFLADMFGNIYMDNVEIIMEYSKYLLNFYLIVYIYCDFIKNDFSKRSVYFFTRTSKRNIWLYKKIIKLTCSICFYYIFQYTFIVILSLFCGLKILSVTKFAILSAYILLSLVLNTLLLILVTNLLAFALNVISSYVVCMSVFSVALLIPCIFYYLDVSIDRFKYLPFFNSILSWHSSLNNIIDRGILRLNFFIVNYNFGVSSITNLSLIFITIIIFCKVIKKVDVI